MRAGGRARTLAPGTRSGAPVGGEVPIKRGSVVRLGEVMTLTFESTAPTKALDEVTVGP